jgi:hypothetical protein
MSAMTYEEPMFQEALTTGADGVFSKTLPMTQLVMDAKRLLAAAARRTESPART